MVIDHDSHGYHAHCFIILLLIGYIVHSHCDYSFILHTVNKKLLMNSHLVKDGIFLHIWNSLLPPSVHS